MFEDATVLGDPNELAALFVPGAVLHRAGRELPVRGRRGIAELLTERPDRPRVRRAGAAHCAARSDSTRTDRFRCPCHAP